MGHERVIGRADVKLSEGIVRDDKTQTISVRTPDDATPWTEFGDYGLPRHYIAEVKPADAALPSVRLDIEAGSAGGDEGPLCVSLSCKPSRTRDEGGQPITRAVLRRVPVDDFVAIATEMVAIRAAVGPDGQPVAESVLWGGKVELVPLEDGTVLMKPGPGAEESVAEFRGYLSARRRPRRRGPSPDEELQRVADVYRAAIDAGEPPTKRVAAEMYDGKRATAGRRIAEARERKFLGKARPATAGEV